MALDNGETTASERYLELHQRREPFLIRARRNSELTIPSLIPPEGHNGHQALAEPYQSLGAIAVTSLASKTMTAFLPPGQKFFRLTIPAEILIQEGLTAAPIDTEKNLTMTEDLLQREVDRRDWRGATNIAAQHLIVAGNYLEQMLPDNTLRGFSLDQYVVARDGTDRLTEIVVQEMYHRDTLPPHLSAIAKEGKNSQPDVALYTWAKRLPDGTWSIHQEIEDQTVPGSSGVYRKNPFRVFRWTRILGQDYGRSKVEEHIADLVSLDNLWKAAIEGAAMASRNITTIRPTATGGLNLRRRIQKAKNGDVLIANEDDVSMLQFENVQGMQFTVEMIKPLEQRIGAAFLMNSAVQRDAERVTKFEVRKMIEELESVLGGVFTSLQSEMQDQRLERLILQMQANNQLPAWPEGLIEPVMLTGLAALGREKDYERATAVFDMTQALQPEERLYIKMPVVLTKAMNGLGFSDSVRTDDEVEEILTRQAQREAMMRAAQGQQAQQPPEGT